MDTPTANQFTLSGRLKPGFPGGLHHQAGSERTGARRQNLVHKLFKTVDFGLNKERSKRI